MHLGSNRTSLAVGSQTRIIMEEQMIPLSLAEEVLRESINRVSDEYEMLIEFIINKLSPYNKEPNMN